MEKIQFFSDFDGTITKEDTLNKFLRDYAHKKWLDVEERWINGEIGSKDCTEQQMKLFPKMEMTEIEKFMDSIEIDETFPHFLEYIRSQGIEFFIISDGFDFFIKAILKKYGIKGVKIFSNKLTIKNGRFYTRFPHYSNDCNRKSGVCKCSVLKSNRIVTNRILYAGDGLSDFCVSDKVDVLFAKGSLLEYSKNTKNNNLIGFETFEEIENYIRQNK